MAEIITIPSLTKAVHDEIIGRHPLGNHKSGWKNIVEAVNSANEAIAKEIRSLMNESEDWESHNESSDRIPSRCARCSKPAKFVELPKEEWQKEYLACFHCWASTHR